MFTQRERERIGVQQAPSTMFKPVSVHKLHTFF